MDDGYFGAIRITGMSFTPRLWAACEGQMVDVSSNPTLFSLLGTAFGGDGRTTFGLPDLRGRTPLGDGAGPNLNTIYMGQKGGIDVLSLQVAHLPPHGHSVTVNAKTGAGDQNDADAGHFATGAFGRDPIVNSYSTTKDATMATDAVEVTNTGGGQPFDNRTPFTGMNYVICTSGLYPSRN